MEEGNTDREPPASGRCSVPQGRLAFWICLNAPGVSADRRACSARGGRRGRCSWATLQGPRSAEQLCDVGQVSQPRWASVSPSTSGGCEI